MSRKVKINMEGVESFTRCPEGEWLARLKKAEMGEVQGSWNINICDASVLAARITGYGISTPPETGPSLEIYDEAFLKGGNKAL